MWSDPKSKALQDELAAMFGGGATGAGDPSSRAPADLFSGAGQSAGRNAGNLFGDATPDTPATSDECGESAPEVRARREAAWAVLSECSRLRRRARLVYRKTFETAGSEPRIVEPAKLLIGKQDVLLRCWQVRPENGERTIMLHRIASAEMTAEPYGRIRSPSVHLGEVLNYATPDPRWTPAMKGYRDLIGDVLADGTVTQAELDALLGHRRNHPDLSDEQVRLVNESLMDRLRREVEEDGVVTDDERRQVANLESLLAQVEQSPGGPSLF